MLKKLWVDDRRPDKAQVLSQAYRSIISHKGGRAYRRIATVDYVANPRLPSALRHDREFIITDLPLGIIVDYIRRNLGSADKWNAVIDVFWRPVLAVDYLRHK